MRIVLLAQSLSGFDGWSRYARDMSKALSKEGHDVEALVAFADKSADWCTQHEVLSSPLHYLNPVSQLLKSQKSLLKKLNPDVVHVIAEPYALVRGIFGNWKTVMTVHGSYAVIPFKGSVITKMLMVRAIKKMHSIIAVSDFTRMYLLREVFHSVDPVEFQKKVHVVHNAIDLSGIEVTQKPKNDVKKILGVGAVKARKGYLEAIRALGAFKKKNSVPFRYEIVGSLDDTKYVETVREEIKAQGLQENVELRGQIPNVELDKAYRAADLFLLLSIQDGPYVEGFVLAFLEANARGVPTIGPNTGGCPEAISEGKSGFVCDPTKPQEVSKRIEDVLMRSAVDTKEARRWAEEHDIEKTAKKIIALY